MRQFAIVVIIVILSAGCVDWICPRLRPRDFADVMEEELNKSPLKTYSDGFFGFSVRYPRCFRKEQADTDDSTGSARFVYDNVTRIVLDCYVCRNVHVSDSDGGIGALAVELRARAVKADGGYILNGPIYENGVRVDGYSHYTKCVARDRLWAVCTLVYPDAHRRRLSRLFGIVEEWKPWNDKTKTDYE